MADYIVEIQGRLYYQRRIPVGVREHPAYKGKAPMIKVALGLSSSERPKARRKARLLNAQYEQEFEAHQRELKAASHLEASVPTTRREPRWVEDMTSEEIREAIISGLVHVDLDNVIPQNPQEFLDKILWARNIRVPPSLAAKLQHAVPMVAALEAYATLRNPFDGSTPSFNFSVQRVKQMYEQWTPPPKAPRVVGLAELIRQYMNEPKRKAMDASARRGYRVAFSYLTDVLGELREVSTIDRQDIKRVREVILSMTQRAKSLPEFRDLKYQEIAAILDARREDDESVQTLKASVANKYLNHITALFRYAVVETYLTRTPAEDLTVPASESRRTSFTPSQLQALFTPEYRLDGLNWLPLLSLYQGCRANELAQLDVADLVQQSGHWCLRITDESHLPNGQVSDKTLKTAASKRVIPLHRRVVDLGFVEYVHQRERDGFRKVFAVTKYNDGNYWDSVRDEIYDLLDRAGVRTDTTTYHSFRHTWNVAMIEAQANEIARKRLGGWTLPAHPADKTYARSISIPYMAQELNRIDFDLKLKRPPG